MMQPRTWLLLTLASLALGGCNVATWGNLLVVALTLAIFCGTLGLGRRTAMSDPASTSDRGNVDG